MCIMYFDYSHPPPPITYSWTSVFTPLVLIFLINKIKIVLNISYTKQYYMLQ
jgi:hypothetical protein